MGREERKQFGEGGTMNGGHQWRGIVGAVTMALTLAATACGGTESAESAEQDTRTSDFSRVVNVEVETIEPRPFVEQIRLTATVQADRDVQLSAEETGVVTEVLAEKGVWIDEGEPIVRLGAKVLQGQVEQARAQAELAAQTWERRKRLWEEDQVGSEIAYLEARFAAEQTAANLRSLEERLARTTIRAPFGGILEDRMVDLGSMVSPGQAVARLVDRTPVKVVAGVPERYAADVHTGARAVVTFDVFAGEVYEAPISYVGSTVDAQSRTFPIEIRMQNPKGLIKPEMVANVSVEQGSLDEALVVPQNALVRVADGYVVFVVEEEGGVAVARSRSVELGSRQRDQVVVQSGLEPGDRIIVVGQKTVAGGDRVNVVAQRDGA